MPVSFYLILFFRPPLPPSVPLPTDVVLVTELVGPGTSAKSWNLHFYSKPSNFVSSSSNGSIQFIAIIISGSIVTATIGCYSGLCHSPQADGAIPPLRPGAVTVAAAAQASFFFIFFPLPFLVFAQNSLPWSMPPPHTSAMFFSYCIFFTPLECGATGQVSTSAPSNAVTSG